MREGRTWRLSTDKASEEFAGVCQKNGAQLGGRGGTGRARGQERTKTIKTEELVTWFCDGGGTVQQGWGGGCSAQGPGHPHAFSSRRPRRTVSWTGTWSLRFAYLLVPLGQLHPISPTFFATWFLEIQGNVVIKSNI